jgi:protein NRD1
MISRHDAVSAREGAESFRSGEMQLRTRWGVGFGPRDCSDYQTGISVIPIERLTDADRKWLHTAEYGGTGGRPIESGMVVEEPDIEIGAGLSSKAISRRIAASTKRGRNSDGFGGGRGGRPDRNGFGSPSQGRLRRN